MKFSLVFVFFVFVISKSKANLLKGACITDDSCNASEYCDHDFPNPVGKCTQGYAEGESCLMDRKCASKRCSLFKCEKRLQMKDGPCKINTDCPDDQYCSKIPETDGLRICTDRKAFGACYKDSQCLSNHCHLFQCTKS